MTIADIFAIALLVLMAIFLGFSVALLVIARADRIAAERSLNSESINIVTHRERRTLVSVIGWAILVMVGIVLVLPVERGASAVVFTAGLFLGLILLGLRDVVELMDRLSFKSVQP
jgi:hypothetical protein